MTLFQKLAGASLLIASLSVAYYFVIFLPEQERKKQELEVARIEINKEKLDSCLGAVDEDVRNDVLETCKSISQIKRLAPNVRYIDLGPDCSVPEESLESLTEKWEKQKKEGREECFKRYPQE